MNAYMMTVVSVVAMMVGLVACEPGGISKSNQSSALSSEQVDAIKQRYDAKVLTIPGVVGSGIGECDGEMCFKVFVVKQTPSLQQALPREFEGVKVEIEETGEMKAQ